jgi:hypothetical protein
VSDKANVVQLVHDEEPAINRLPLCVDCRFFQPAVSRWRSGRCGVTGTRLEVERIDYSDEISCGPEGRWFRPVPPRRTLWQILRLKP